MSYKLSPNTNRYFAKQKYWQVNQEIGFLHFYNLYVFLCLSTLCSHGLNIVIFFYLYNIRCFLCHTTNKIIINRFLKSYRCVFVMCFVRACGLSDGMSCQKTTVFIYCINFFFLFHVRNIISNWHFHFQIQSYLTNTDLITFLPKTTLLLWYFCCLWDSVLF